jgi:rRNA maturation endonuclease Nob1
MVLVEARPATRKSKIGCDTCGEAPVLEEDLCVLCGEKIWRFRVKSGQKARSWKKAIHFAVREEESKY